MSMDLTRPPNPLPPWRPPERCPLCGLDILDGQSRVQWWADDAKYPQTAHRACRDQHSSKGGESE